MATILAPVPRRRKMRPEEIDAKGRLLATTGNQNPTPRAVVIDGQQYLVNGRPAYGSGGGMRLGDEVVGVGRQTFGFGAGGGMGSGLMRGRLPASMESPQSAARGPVEYKRGLGAMVGGNVVAEDDFQQAWKERQAAIARGQTPPGPAKLMAGIAERATPMLTRTMGEVTIPQMVQDLQRQPIPIAPAMRPYAMSDRYGGSNVGMLNAAARSASAGSAGMGYSPVAASAGMIPSMAVGGAPKFFDVDAALGFRRAAEMNPSAAVSRMPTSPVAGTVRQPIDPLGGSSIGAVGTAPSPTGGTVAQPPNPLGGSSLGVNYGPGGQPPPVAPVAPNNVNYQQGHWFPGQQTQGPATAVVNSTAGGSVAPAAVTPTAPVPATGMSTRAKVLTGVGAGVGALGLYSMANNGDQVVVPTLPTAPAGQQSAYYNPMYSSKTIKPTGGAMAGGLTVSPQQAAHRTASEAAWRRTHGGKSPTYNTDLMQNNLARYYQQNPQAYSEDMIRMEAASNAGRSGNQYADAAMIEDQTARAALMAKSLSESLAAERANPQPNADRIAQLESQIAEIGNQRAYIAPVMTAQQRMQGMLPQQRTVSPQVVGVPVAPVQSSGTQQAGTELNNPPQLRGDPPAGMTREQYAAWMDEESKTQKKIEEIERKKQAAASGRIPWSAGDQLIAEKGSREQAAKKFVELYGMKYEDALREVDAHRALRQEQASGLTIPIGY